MADLTLDELKLFRGQNYQINDFLTVRHPTLGQICDYGEKEFYNIVYTLCATPSDFQVQLDDMGYRFEDIDEFTFFGTLCASQPQKNTEVLLGDIDLSSYILCKNKETSEVVLYSEIEDRFIREVDYQLMTIFLRKIFGLKKRTDRYGNEASRRVAIEEERRIMERNIAEPYKSSLVPLISSMINCENFKYDHKSVWDLPIYTFMDSVQRIQKIKNYELIMTGAYSGNVDLKKIPQSSLNWMGELNLND